MMNEDNGIEVDIDNYCADEHVKRGGDDIHFADDDDSNPAVLQTDLIGNNDPERRSPPSRRKRAAIVFAAIASFGAIIGLGYGIGYGIGGTSGNKNNKVMSSNMNAVTLEDCLDYSSSSNSIPTYSPTTYYPTSSPLSKEEKLVTMFFPVFSNDIPIITDDDETTTQAKQDGVENGNDNDGPVRRLGSPLVMKSSSSQDGVEQRKLACDKLLRN